MNHEHEAQHAESSLPQDAALVHVEPLVYAEPAPEADDQGPIEEGDGVAAHGADPCAVTVLTCRPGKRAAKQFQRLLDGSWKVDDYDCGWRFALSTHRVEGLAGLSALLRELQEQPRSFIVRGARLDGQTSCASTARTLKPHPKTGEPAALGEADRLWIGLDIDDLPTPMDPEGRPMGGPLDWIKYAIRTLPSAFHKTGCHWQWSSSAGVKGWATLRLHLWFWADRPVCGRSLRAWLKGRVDTSFFSANSVHYTARPVFLGQTDILGTGRCGLIEGPPVVLPEQVVDLATWSAQEAAKLAASRQAQAQLASQLRARQAQGTEAEAAIRRYVEAAMRGAQDAILGAGKGARHQTLYAQGAALGEIVGGGYLSHAEALAVLCEAAGAALAGEGREAEVERTAREALEVGAREPRDLSHVGTSSQSRLRPPMPEARWSVHAPGNPGEAPAWGAEFGHPAEFGGLPEFGSAPEFGNGPEFGVALGEASAPPAPPDPPKPAAPVPPARDLVAEARARVAQIVREVGSAPDKLERIKALLLDGGVLAALGLLPVKEAEVFFFDLSQHRGAGKLVAALRRAYKDQLKEAASEEAQIITDSRPRGPQPGQLAVGDEERWWSYGAEVHAYRVRRVERAEVVVAQLLAWSVWPQARTMDLHSGDHGAEVIYRTPQGAMQRAVIEAGAWVDEGSASAAAGRLARCGARIAEGAGAAFTLAIGAWANRASAETRISVGRPGWQREPGSGRLVYVNGAEVHGASWLWTGGPLRSARKGDLEAWRTKTQELATTQGLKLALGVSFAGALLDPLDLDPFLVHIHGASSGGKTRAAKLAAAVWHSPADLLRYNGSQKGLVLATEERASACVALDEIKEISPEELATFLHTFTDGRSRTLAQRTGQALQEQRRFRATGFSTGEASMGERLGDLQQGGQSVRAVDVELLVGEACQSEAHADELDALVAECHGVAGNAWAKWLAGLGEEGWEQVRSEVGRVRASLGGSVGDDRELGRIGRAVAVACAALRLASACGAVGLAFSEGDAKSLAAWTLERARFNRGERVSPESRALDILRSAYEAQPDAFPTEDQYASVKRPGGVWGIAETREADINERALIVERFRRQGIPEKDCPPSAFLVRTGRVFTVQSMLVASKACEKAGVGPTRLAQFLQDQKLAVQTRRFVGGVRRPWWLVDLNRPDLSAEDG